MASPNKALVEEKKLLYMNLMKESISVVPLQKSFKSSKRSRQDSSSQSLATFDIVESMDQKDMSQIGD